MARILLVRHGETVGQSSLRYHGSRDVALSDEGRDQMRAAQARLPDQGFDQVFASPLSRSWESARILMPDARITLEADFREIDFGRWEGLTVEEIEARDPGLYRAWREGDAGFEFPDGERRGAFRSRVERGLERVLESGARSAVIVAHKGIVRTIAEKLTGVAPEQPHPELGEGVYLSRGAAGHWSIGPRSSRFAAH